MKKLFTYSAIVLLLAAATACDKTESVISGNDQIRLALTSVETRALVESAADLQSNQTIKVFDILDGTSYFDADETVKYENSAWNFQKGIGYTWKTGTHKFFAYTDGAGSFADNVLTVSKTLTTADADQVDIVYSEIVSKTAEQAKADNYAPVPLNMEHLFSAVAITVRNFSGNEVTLNSVSKPAIPNSGSATVDFTGDAVAVTYGDVTASGDFSTATALSNVTLAAAVEAQKATETTEAVEAKDGGRADVIAQAAAEKDGYWVVWPQTLEAGAIKVTVKYTMTGKEYEKEISLPAATWEKGNKYTYTLAIYPTDVRLVFKVQPWDTVDEVSDIDTEDGSINMSNVTWQNTKVDIDGDGVFGEVESESYIDESGKQRNRYLLHENTVQNELYTVMMYKDPILESGQYSGYFPAQGYFTVNYPKSGVYKIGLIPAYGETQVDTTKYVIQIYHPNANQSLPGTWQRHAATSGETISQNTVYFRVCAADDQDGAEHKAQVDIWFKPTGSDEWISAYSEVRANYACVIPKTN